MISSPLSHELNRYSLLRQRLLEAFPDLDDETIRDTLEGISNLNGLITAIVRSALIDEALQAGLRTRLDDMTKRLSRFEERGVKKRQLALQAMSEAGLSKLEEADFTVSLRAGAPSLVVVTEEQVPDDYWVPQPPKLNRQALLNGLKTGQDIPGVQLSNRKSILTVRTK